MSLKPLTAIFAVFFTINAVAGTCDDLLNKFLSEVSMDTFETNYGIAGKKRTKLEQNLQNVPERSGYAHVQAEMKLRTNKEIDHWGVEDLERDVYLTTSKAKDAEKILDGDPIQLMLEKSDQRIKEIEGQDPEIAREFELISPRGSKFIFGFSNPEFKQDIWFRNIDSIYSFGSGEANTYKIYLGLPAEQIYSEVGAILDLGKAHNMKSFKFAATAQAKERADRFIVYFKNPEDAIAFARKVEESLTAKNYPDLVPDQTYVLGKHTSIGVDRKNPKTFPHVKGSHRQNIARATAKAIKACRKTPSKCRQLTCKIFQNMGYLAENYLPVEVAPLLGVDATKCN